MPALRRILFYTHASTGVTLLDASGYDASDNDLVGAWVTTLSAPISNVVGLDLVTCSTPGYALAIDGWPGVSRLATGAPYFRFASALHMPRSSAFPEEPVPATTLGSISFRWLDPTTGDTAYLGPTIFELDVWVEGPSPGPTTKGTATAAAASGGAKATSGGGGGAAAEGDDGAWLPSLPRAILDTFR